MNRLALPARRTLAILASVLIATIGVTTVLAQALGPAAPSPAEEHAAVIAHALVDVDADETVWRARVLNVTNETQPIDATTPLFAVADDIPVIAEDGNSGLMQRVASGEAAVIAAGSVATLSSTGPPANATLIDLVPSNEAEENDEAFEDTHVTEPFTLHAGTYDVDLIRITLADGEFSSVQAGNGPSFVVGERGQVLVEAEDTELLMNNDGERLVDGSITVSASNGAASVLVLRIGPVIDQPAAATPATPEATSATPIGTPEPVETPESSSTPEIIDATDSLVPATIEDEEAEPTEAAPEDEPQDLDFDEDGIDNSDEIAIGTDPDVPDTDEDGLTDADEVLRGTDPLVADTDDDGVDDGAEVDLGTDPLNIDTDGDVLYDGGELIFETDPLAIDSDGDGLTDGDEVYFTETNPIAVDTDGDQFSDLEEVNAGTDPLDPNSFP